MCYWVLFVSGVLGDIFDVLDKEIDIRLVSSSRIHYIQAI